MTCDIMLKLLNVSTHSLKRIAKEDGWIEEIMPFKIRNNLTMVHRFNNNTGMKIIPCLAKEGERLKFSLAFSYAELVLDELR